MGGLSDPSDRRSPVEAMRSVGVSLVAQTVKERVAAVCCCDGVNIRALIIYVNKHAYKIMRGYKKARSMAGFDWSGWAFRTNLWHAL